MFSWFSTNPSAYAKLREHAQSAAYDVPDPARGAEFCEPVAVDALEIDVLVVHCTPKPIRLRLPHPKMKNNNSFNMQFARNFLYGFSHLCH